MVDLFFFFFLNKYHNVQDWRFVVTMYTLHVCIQLYIHICNIVRVFDRYTHGVNFNRLLSNFLLCPAGTPGARSA